MVSQNELFPPERLHLYAEGEANGRNQNVFTPTRICQICEGAGRLRVNIPCGDPSFGKSVPCSCVEVRQRSLRQQQIRDVANMDAFREKTFKTFNTRIPGVQKACLSGRDYAANPQGCLLLLGPCGCGKTHLAAAIANRRLESGAIVFFTTVPDLLDALRAAFASSEQYTHLFTLVREIELLVLDDFGAQQPSSWSNEKLLQILDYRLTRAMPTIITAIPKELKGLDERLRSRLMDSRVVTTGIFENTQDLRSHKPVSSRSQ